MTPAAPIPPPFEGLEGRRFSFHPPILQVGSNEWTYRRATWSEILVRSASGGDLWIPRRFLGAASALHFPVVRISLLEQLEYRDGGVWPCKRRVIEMPGPSSIVETRKALREGPELAPVIGIRLESRSESRAGRIAGGAIALGVLGCLAVVGYSLQGGDAHRRSVIRSLDQTYLHLTVADRYETVVQALGVPDSDRWVTIPDGKRLHVLNYSGQGFSAVLMSTAPRREQVYIGAVDEDGRVLQSVLLPDGSGTTAGWLHALENI